MLLIIILFLILVVAGIVEYAIIASYRKEIPIRILVNGSRGKTSTSRMVCYSLNGSGITTCGKVTGSEARFLLPNGNEIPTNRNRGINLVREYKKILQLSLKNHCQAIVCECMAINKENQKVVKQILKPNFAIITNCWVDHKDAMG